MITYSATLDVPEEAATLLVELLVAERLRRGTGVGARAATCRQQAILVLRWFRDDADMKIDRSRSGRLSARIWSSIASSESKRAGS